MLLNWFKAKRIRQLIQNTLHANGYINWSFVGDCIAKYTYSASWINRANDRSIITLIQDVRKPKQTEILEFNYSKSN